MAAAEIGLLFLSHQKVIKKEIVGHLAAFHVTVDMTFVLSKVEQKVKVVTIVCDVSRALNGLPIYIHIHIVSGKRDG